MMATRTEWTGDLLWAILTEEFHFDIGKTLTLCFIDLAHRSIAHSLEGNRDTLPISKAFRSQSPLFAGVIPLKAATFRSWVERIVRVDSIS